MYRTTRLLLVGNFLSKSVGTRTNIEDLKERLENKGYQAYATTSHQNSILRVLDMLQTVLRLHRSYDLSIVDLFSGRAFLWGQFVGLLLRNLSKPFILNLQGGGLPEYARHNEKQVRNLLDAAAKVVTPSLYIKECFSSLCADIHILPNPLDINRYRFQIRENPSPKLCWLRAFHNIYNPTLAIRVLSLLKERFANVELAMIGPNKNDGSFQQAYGLAVQLGVADHLQIVGSVPKAAVPNWLNRSDIFLNTTRYESFGVAVMEAAACGLPIVSTNVGELSFLWDNGRDALLSSPNSPQDLAKAIERILRDKKLATQLSTNARQKAEKYDWSFILPQWESLINGTVE